MPGIETLHHVKRLSTPDFADDNPIRPHYEKEKEGLSSNTLSPSFTNNLSGLSFGLTASGEWGYRKPGADTVTPFSSFRGVELICAVQARFYNSSLGAKRDLFTGNVIITIDKDGNVTLPQELKLNRNGVNVPTPTAVYFTILSVTVNFL